MIGINEWNQCDVHLSRCSCTSGEIRERQAHPKSTCPHCGYPGPLTANLRGWEHVTTNDGAACEMVRTVSNIVKTPPLDTTESFQNVPTHPSITADHVTAPRLTADHVTPVAPELARLTHLIAQPSFADLIAAAPPVPPESLSPTEHRLIEIITHTYPDTQEESPVTSDNKNSQPPAYRNPRPLLIGIGGALRSGKDTVADQYVEWNGFTKTFMSDPLHEALWTLDPYVPVERRVWGLFRRVRWERYSELCDRLGYTEAKTYPEARRLLQKLGTDVGRDMIGVNTWADIAERNIRDLMEDGHSVALTGVRFPNELEMIKRLGGVSVWIEREQPTSDAHQHSSETSVNKNMFDYTLFNGGTLGQLHTSAMDMLTFIEEKAAEPVPSTEAHDWPNYDF